jgi:hypothetical protein
MRNVTLVPKVGTFPPNTLPQGSAMSTSTRVGGRNGPLAKRQPQKPLESQLKLSRTLNPTRSLTLLGAVLGALCTFATLERSALAQDLFAKETAHARAKRSLDSPQWFAFELRFAPYVPKVDEAPELGGKTPLCATYGTVARNGTCSETPNPRLMVGAEFDFQALKIPYVGTLGPGLSFNYMKMSRPALTSVGKEPSGQDTTLEVFPMHLSAVLRVDALHKHLRVPLVPYVKGGVGFGLWRNYGPTGTVKIGEGTSQVSASGTALGSHLALGMMLRLDFLDADSAREIDDAVGVNHTSLFAEYMMLNLNQSGALRVGTRTAVFGLALEF